MILRGSLRLRSVVLLSSVSTIAAAQSKDYVVKKGDSCVSVAIAEYGDKRYVDLLHQGNPQLGKPPHALQVGSVLTLLPKPIPAPDARVDFVRNKVEVAAPTPKPAHKDELLFRGNRVSTQENSAADVLFIESKGLMRLSEHTLVIILDASKGTLATQPRETTLVTGALRTRLSELSGGSEVINTPAGKVVIGTGETKLDVDAKKTARLAVYKGKGTITAQNKTVTVPENFGAKAEEGKAPTDPKPLPGIPGWSPAPPGVVWVETSAGAAGGKYAPSAKGAEVASWHVQIARDSEFHDVVVDVRVPRSIDSIETKEVTQGPYFFRVSGVDADTFEGPFSEAKRTQAGRLYWAAEKGASAGTGRVVSAPDLNCTVDGKSAREPISAYETHRVLCTTLDGTALPERVLAGLPRPPTPPSAKPAPSTSSAPKEPVLIAAEVSAGFTSRLPLSIGGGLGVRVPLEGVSFQVGVRVGYETSIGSLSGTSARQGDYSFDVGTVRTDIPFMVRFGKGVFGPTLTLGPQLFVQTSNFAFADGSSARGYTLSFGLMGKIGAELQVGPGAFFGDIGYRGASPRTVDFANVAVRGATFDLGYRFLLK